MSVHYTAGNFTVDSQYVDSKAAIAITRPVPDIDWSADFSQKSINKDQCELVNRTGASLAPCETVTVARTEISDIYKNTSVDAAHRLADTRGVRVMIQARDEYKAVNSLNGEEYSLPARAWICVETPVAPLVQQDIPLDIVNRVLGMLAQTYTAATSATSMDTVIGAIKGDLSPKAVNNQN